MTTSPREAYHHGDLASALLSTAMKLLEAGEPFSLREVARRAGVSPAAPYRHYADKDALESALAAEGFRDLWQRLAEVSPTPSAPSDLAELSVTYVFFALQRPALFRLMFGNECNRTDDERVQAAEGTRQLLAHAVASIFPDAETEALTTAGWSLVHGLAFLHLDGKFDAHDPDAVAARVRAAVNAVLRLSVKDGE